MVDGTPDKTFWQPNTNDYQRERVTLKLQKKEQNETNNSFITVSPTQIASDLKLLPVLSALIECIMLY